MKHLFNNLDATEKNQILEMHYSNKNIISESQAEIQKLATQGQEFYNSMSEPEKMKFRKAFKACWKEMGFPTAALTFATIFALVGIYFIFKKGDINVVTAGMGALGVGFGILDAGQIKKFVQCIRTKMNEPEIQIDKTEMPSPPTDPDVKSEQ
jgi:hypothetical protein